MNTLKLHKMQNKTTITEKQKLQFNLMLKTLKRIKGYESLKGLRKNCEKNWGIIFGEALEAAYENIQEEASLACKNVKPLI